MKLTRRDALLALGAASVGAAAVGSARQTTSVDLSEAQITTRLHAVAESVYPEEIEVTRGFIVSYAQRRLENRDEYRHEQADALEILDNRARSFAGRPYPSLSIDRRQTVLRDMGVLRALPVPDGTAEERIRFFVVNDLLYVLFSTPTGGEALGCANPPGYPGGLEAYQGGSPG